jgi:hypothetical protein
MMLKKKFLRRGNDFSSMKVSTLVARLERDIRNNPYSPRTNARRSSAWRELRRRGAILPIEERIQEIASSKKEKDVTAYEGLVAIKGWLLLGSVTDHTA